MAFEVTCSQCQGRLMVAQPGQVVACPHCHTHLTVPAPAPAVPVQPAPPPPADPVPADPVPASDAASVPEVSAGDVTDSAVPAPAADHAAATADSTTAEPGSVEASPMFVPQSPGLPAGFPDAPGTEAAADPFQFPPLVHPPADSGSTDASGSPEVTPDIDPAAPVIETAAPPSIPVANPDDPGNEVTSALDSPSEPDAPAPPDAAAPESPATESPVTTAGPVSSDNPFADGMPDFSAGFGSPSPPDDPFTGNTFDFGTSGDTPATESSPPVVSDPVSSPPPDSIPPAATDRPADNAPVNTDDAADRNSTPAAELPPLHSSDAESVTDADTLPQASPPQAAAAAEPATAEPAATSEATAASAPPAAPLSPNPASEITATASPATDIAAPGITGPETVSGSQPVEPFFPDAVSGSQVTSPSPGPGVSVGSTDTSNSDEAAPAVTSPVPSVTAPPDSVPRSKYVLVLSWASAATLAALFLLYLLSMAQSSQLESLPDVKPPRKDDKIVYQLVPEEAAMPPGHTLSLGDTQRYGNLKVTALRVTRGPVQFEHYDPSTSRTRDQGPEVLKLWLRFENVSTDQSIAPLDELVFQRDDRDFENVRANTFLAPVSQKSKSGKRLMVYDLNTSGDWNLKAQHVEYEIPPGEQFETYIPTTPEGLAEILGSDEELVWRVHFRKGYSPKKYGVTTVIEVKFTASEIESDSLPPSPADASAPSRDA